MTRMILNESTRHAVAAILMEAIGAMARQGAQGAGGMSMQDTAHNWAVAVYNVMQGREGVKQNVQGGQRQYSAMDWHWKLYSEFTKNFSEIMPSMYKASGQQISTMSGHTKAQKAKIAQLGPKGTVDIPQSMYNPSKYLQPSTEAMRDILSCFFTPKEFEGLEWNSSKIVKRYLESNGNPDFNGDDIFKQILSSLRVFVYHTIKGDKEFRVSNTVNNIRIDGTNDSDRRYNFTGSPLPSNPKNSQRGIGMDDDYMDPEGSLVYDIDTNAMSSKAIGNRNILNAVETTSVYNPIYYINRLKKLLKFVASGNSGHLSGFYDYTNKNGTIFKHFLIHAARYISDHFDEILTPERLEEIRAIGNDKNKTRYSYKPIKDKFRIWSEDAICDECYKAIDSNDLDNDILKAFPGILKDLMKVYGTPNYRAQKEKAKKDIGEGITKQMAVFWNNLNPDRKSVKDANGNTERVKPQRIGQEALRVINGVEPTYRGKFDKKQSDKFLTDNPRAFRQLDPSVDMSKIQTRSNKDSKVSEKLARTIGNAVLEAVKRRIQNMI